MNNQELQDKLTRLQRAICCNKPQVVGELPVGNEGNGFVIFEGDLYFWDGDSWEDADGSGSSVWGLITGAVSDQTDLQSELDNKQDNLVSGTNIKTLNSTSLLGSGDIITPVPEWGGVIGTLADQVDLQSALNSKESALAISTGLTRSVNTVTSNIATGVAGSQTIYGGIAANEDLTIQGTLNATKSTSYVNLQPDGGSVGIGTNTPLARLHVSGTGTNFRFNNAALDGFVISQITTNSWGCNGLSGGMFFNLQNSHFIIPQGKLGVMTTVGVEPLASLHVKGEGATSATNALRVENSASSVAMVVRNDGNVGIGEIVPTTKLHVAGGTIRATAIGTYASTLLAAADGALLTGTMFKVTNGDGTSTLHIKD